MNGFGAVFTDVDISGPTRIEYFDAAGQSLGSFPVPATGGNQTLSFLGVSFPDGERAAAVTITAGDQVLATGNNNDDLVVMDDFVYGEPRAVPPPPLTLNLKAKSNQAVEGLCVRPPARTTAGSTSSRRRTRTVTSSPRRTRATISRRDREDRADPLHEQGHQADHAT